jgi:hypothetical protein
VDTPTKARTAAAVLMNDNRMGFMLSAAWTALLDMWPIRNCGDRT